MVFTTYGLPVADVAWQIVTLSEGVALTPGITMKALTPTAPTRPIVAATPQRTRWDGPCGDGAASYREVCDMRLPRRSCGPHVRPDNEQLGS